VLAARVIALVVVARWLSVEKHSPFAAHQRSTRQAFDAAVK
jgi:hypothetical protein